MHKVIRSGSFIKSLWWKLEIMQVTRKAGMGKLRNESSKCMLDYKVMEGEKLDGKRYGQHRSMVMKKYR